MKLIFSLTKKMNTVQELTANMYGVMNCTKVNEARYIFWVHQQQNTTPRGNQKIFPRLNWENMKYTLGSEELSSQCCGIFLAGRRKMPFFSDACCFPAQASLEVGC